MFRFLRREDGAITVDWVVLCASLVALSLAVMATVAAPAKDNAASLGSYMSNQTINSY